MKYGIQCHCSFGDCIFNTALCRSVAAQHGGVGVATQPQYMDAYRNLPYVTDLVESAEALRELGYEVVDVTPCNHFHVLKSHDHEFSLVDSHRTVWEQRAGELALYDPTPEVAFSPAELWTAANYREENGGRLVAIESVAFSGQSWADGRAWDMILDRHRADRVLWVSNQNAPDLPNVDDLLRYDRRQVMAILSVCDDFYSTGSGFFCSSVAMQTAGSGPGNTTCLWIDGYYRYESKFKQLGWDAKIRWAHDHEELKAALAK